MGRHGRIARCLTDDLRSERVHGTP
jgi:hypothetical protein